MENILDRELTPEEEKVLRESLENWKEETYAQLMEDVESLKEQKIEELEEAAIAYKEELKEEFANKMITALNEMRDEIKAEVLAEMVESNPEMQVLEKIKEAVAPLLGEEYYANTYSESITQLQRRIDELEEEQNLDEGAKTLAGLIAPYSEKTQKLILALIKEGGPEEVTEQFYTIVEQLEDVFDEAKDEEVGEGEMDQEEDDENEDEEDEPKSKKKKSKKDEEEDEDEEEPDEDEDDKKKSKSKKSKDEDEEMGESFIEEGLSGLTEEVQPKRSLKDSIRNIARQ